MGEARRKRRIAETRMRKMGREISAPGYSPIRDPEFVKGIANTVRAVEFTGLGGGLCLLNALTAMQALESCNVEASLHIGSLVCRVGPDPRRDVVAFCGPGNAGYGQLFHAWVEVDNYLLDFSVGDWQRLNPVTMEITAGLAPLAPVQWQTTLPQYWCKPRATLVDPWRADSTPALREAWYGPYNDDPFVKAEQIRAVAEEVGPLIADAVETVIARAAAQQGLPRPDRNAQPVRINPIIEAARNAPMSAPPGMVQMMLSEIFRLAGFSLGDCPDAVSYVYQRPTTREQARVMLMNMSISSPR